MIVEAKDYGHGCYEVRVRTHDETEYNAIQSYVKNLGETTKPMTNGDRIRAMGDEVLASVFGFHSICSHINTFHYELCETQPVCTNCVLEWLKQPAEVDHDTD